MKLYILHKVGYTAGVYGNSGEQFLLVMIDTDRPENDQELSIVFDGMYGHERRVIEPLRSAGYKAIYTPTFFGKATRKDCSYKYVKSENQALEEVKQFIG